MTDHFDDNPKAEYDVGYGKPPVNHRFKPGNNANPKGRPRKAAKSASEILDKVLNETAQVTVEGKRVRMTMRELNIRGMVQSAIKGNFRFASLLLQHDEHQVANGGGQNAILEEAERELLQRYLRDVANGTKPDLDGNYSDTEREIDE